MKYTSLLLIPLIVLCACSDVSNSNQSPQLSIKATFPSYDSFSVLTGAFSVNFDIDYTGLADKSTIYFEAYKKGKLSQKMKSLAGFGENDKPKPIEKLKVFISILDSKNSSFQLQTNDDVGDDFYVFTTKSVIPTLGTSNKFSCNREIFEFNAIRSWATFPSHDLTQKFIPIFYIVSVEGDAAKEHGLQNLTLRDDGRLDIKDDQDYIIFYLQLHNKPQANQSIEAIVTTPVD